MARKKDQSGIVGKSPDGTYPLISSESEIEILLRECLSGDSSYSFDLETQGLDEEDKDSALDPFNASIEYCSLSFEEGVGYTFPWRVLVETSTLFSLLKELLEKKPGIYANAKFDFQMMLANHGIEAAIKSDVLVQQYVLNPDEEEKGLKSAAMRLLGYQMTQFEEMTAGDQLSQVDGSTVSAYAGADADMTRRINFLLAPQIEAIPSLPFIEAVDTALIPVIGKMELRGIPVDKEYLATFQQRIQPAVEALRQEIFLAVGHPFELDSPKQLGDVLYKELGLAVSKTTKSGQASTAVAALSKLAEDNEIVGKVREYKTMQKMSNTFVQGIINGTCEKTGCCHPSFLTTVVPTGRLACSTGNIGGGGYNLQQIPKSKTKLGGDMFSMRKAFIPHEDYILGEADYKAIEFRIFLNMAHQETIIEEILAGIDVHRQTYAAIFDMKLEEVNKDQREQGKTFNYGLLYGMAPFSLAGRIKSTEEQAEFIINRFFERMDKVWIYSRQIEAFAKRYKFVQTVFGRRRYINDLLSNDRALYRRGLRGAVNTVIQGTAADIMRMALIRLDKMLSPFGDKVRLLLTIHDSVVWEQHKSIPTWEVLQVIREAMEFPVEGWRLPMEIDAKLGNTWGDAMEVSIGKEADPVFDILYKGEELNAEDGEGIVSIAKEHPGDFKLRIKVSGSTYINGMGVNPFSSLGKSLVKVLGSRAGYRVQA